MDFLNPRNSHQRKVREIFGKYDPPLKAPQEAWPFVHELARAINPNWVFNQDENEIRQDRIIQEYGEPEFQYLGYRCPILTPPGDPTKKLIGAIDGRLAYARLEVTLDNQFGDLFDLSDIFKEIQGEVRRRNAVFGFYGQW